MLRRKEQSESYFMLVRRRFKKSLVAKLGFYLTIFLIFISVFSDFFAPYNPRERFQNYQAPTSFQFKTHEGGLSFLPFYYPLEESDEYDPITFQPLMKKNIENPVKLKFFVKGWDYKIFGLIQANIHFVGTSNLNYPIHFMGTDKLGRDVFSRSLVGSRLSLFIAFIVVSITVAIGSFTGILSGYLGGKFDAYFQRLVELILAFPQLPLYLTLATLIPITSSSQTFIFFLVCVLSALLWARVSREVRGKTLSLSHSDFIKSAQAVGASNMRIIMRHILPNVMSHIIIVVTIMIPEVILLESFLGFLGFSVKPPEITWGLMLQDVRDYGAIGSHPWLLLPVSFIFIAVFAFNAFGDGLRDAVDPYRK